MRKKRKQREKKKKKHTQEHLASEKERSKINKRTLHESKECSYGMYALLFILCRRKQGRHKKMQRSVETFFCSFGSRQVYPFLFPTTTQLVLYVYEERLTFLGNMEEGSKTKAKCLCGTCFACLLFVCLFFVAFHSYSRCINPWSLLSRSKRIEDDNMQAPVMVLSLLFLPFFLSLLHFELGLSFS